MSMQVHFAHIKTFALCSTNQCLPYGSASQLPDKQCLNDMLCKQCHSTVKSAGTCSNKQWIAQVTVCKNRTSAHMSRLDS